MNEEITLRLETFNDKEYILADECIKAIGIHRKTNAKLHKEIKRLKEEYMILQNASDEVEEEKDKEIERLTAESTKWESKFYDEAKKVDKAIEKIESIRIYGLRSGKTLFATLLNEILDILKGSDKE